MGGTKVIFKGALPPNAPFPVATGLDVPLLCLNLSSCANGSERTEKFYLTRKLSIFTFLRPAWNQFASDVAVSNRVTSRWSRRCATCRLQYEFNKRCIWHACSCLTWLKISQDICWESFFFFRKSCPEVRPTCSFLFVKSSRTTSYIQSAENKKTSWCWQQCVLLNTAQKCLFCQRKCQVRGSKNQCPLNYSQRYA